MALRSKPKKEEHTHDWKSGNNPSFKVCFCKCILVSTAEFIVRRKMWSVYYAKVRETRAYKRFSESAQAFNNKDMVRVKELAKEAKEQLLSGKGFLSTPSFPDTDWKGYVVQ